MLYWYGTLLWYWISHWFANSSMIHWYDVLTWHFQYTKLVYYIKIYLTSVLYDSCSYDSAFVYDVLQHSMFVTLNHNILFRYDALLWYDHVLRQHRSHPDSRVSTQGDAWLVTQLSHVLVPTARRLSKLKIYIENDSRRCWSHAMIPWVANTSATIDPNDFANHPSIPSIDRDELVPLLHAIVNTHWIYVSATVASPHWHTVHFEL